MSNYNKAIIFGRAGGVPKANPNTNGAETNARFGLVTTRNRKDKDGKWQEEPHWHTVRVFGKQAEYALANVAKGAEVRIEGEITYRTYTGKDGVEKSITEIMADRIKVTRKAKQEGQADAAPDKTAASEPAAEFDENNPQF